MPSRNVIKTYITGNYYHVYNRGVAAQPIFLDVQDKQHFLDIMGRYLDPTNDSIKSDGTSYRKFDQDIELLCYCLMGNHFHLLLYIRDDPHALPSFIQSALTAYSMYFNKRYKRIGTLFQGVFKASMILDDCYLLHITRYIHMNPRTYKTYHYSSLREYLGKRETSWIHHQRILSLFDSETDYIAFLEDLEGYSATLDAVKKELA